MKRILAAAALITVTSGVAFAADQLTPGTPGDTNCVGQTMAYIAQLGKNGPVDGNRGIGGYSDFTGLSVKQIRAIVEAHCTL